MEVKLLFVTCIIFIIVGCSTQRFVLNENQQSSVPTYEGTHHFLFWGLGQTKELIPEDVCGNRGVAAVESSTSVVNILLSSITYGIYSPRAYAVYCNRDTAPKKYEEQNSKSVWD